MLREVFYWLFNMSVAGALSGAVVLLLRLVKKIPRRVIAVLWAIPFLRLWVPVGIGGRFGLMALLFLVRWRRGGWRGVDLVS